MTTAKAPRRALVVQWWGVGDMIMTTPMLGALRASNPGVRITVVAGSGPAASVVDGSHLCDVVEVVDDAQRRSAFLISRLLAWRREQFDFAILATRHSRVLALLLRIVCGIRVVAGDSIEGGRRSFSHWRGIQPGEHRVDANLEILRLLFPAVSAAPLHMTLDERSRQEADSLAAALWANPGEYVLGVHPGSSSGEGRDKRIPPAIAVSVVDRFLSLFPRARVLVFLGPSEEENARWFNTMDSRIQVVSGLRLRTVAALIAKLDVFLDGDSGLGHVAAAVGIPVMTLAGPTEISCTHPWGVDHRMQISKEDLECRPCYGTSAYGRCPIAQRCMTNFNADDVVVALPRLGFQKSATRFGSASVTSKID